MEIKNIGAKVTLLVIGEPKDWDAYLKMCRNLRSEKLKNYNYVIETYESLAENNLPTIDSEVVLVFLFFPHSHWNKYIECKGYTGLYGNCQFYQKFLQFWSKINMLILSHYHDKTVYYLNHPLYISTDRDKELTKLILQGAGVNVPESIFTREYEQIVQLVEAGENLYLKVRYGSMGKGITCVEQGKWRTNFEFVDGKIVNCDSEYNWRFHDITGNEQFLRELLQKDIVIEKAVPTGLIRGFRYDLRFYVFLGQVLYVYARVNDSESVTTNISQGGQGRDARFLQNIPPRALEKAKKIAIRAAKALALDLAGVDVMFSADFKQIYVVELNAFPGYPSSKGFNLSRRILEVLDQTAWEVK